MEPTTNTVSQHQTNKIAALWILIASFLTAFWSTDMDYLEDEGVTFFQMYVIAQCSTALYTVTVWVLSSYLFSTNLYHYLKTTSNNNNDDINNDENNEDNNTIPTFKDNLLSTLPSTSFETMTKEDKQQWYVLLARGCVLSFEIEFYIITLSYIESGDAMLIRTALSSLSGVFIGIILFGERLSLYVIVSFVLCVAGLILICQPTFIFSASDSDYSLSLYGLLFCVLSAVFRVSDKTLIKQSGNLRINSLVIVLVPYVVTSVIALFQFLVIYIYLVINNDLEEMDDIWYDWFGKDSDGSDESSEVVGFMTAAAVCYGLITLGVSFFNVLGYSKGQLGRLGIIANTDVPSAYVLEILLLDKIDNVYTYVGVFIVLFAISLLMYEQTRKQGTIGEDGDDADAGYEQIIDDTAETGLAQSQLTEGSRSGSISNQSDRIMFGDKKSGSGNCDETITLLHNRSA